MKRIAVIGVLILILATFAGPAFAQTDEGSALPPPGSSQVLPGSTQVLPQAQSQSAAQQGGALADTGLGLTNGAVLAIALLAVGASTLAAGRRRATR